MDNKLILSKLQPPALGKEIIYRDRLISRFCSFAKTKITYVTAPAGYGKTVFVKQLVDSAEIPYVWYHLDDFDNDPIQFFQYLAKGLSLALPSLQIDVPKFNPEDIKNDKKYYGIMAAIISELEKKADKGLIIVFDDFHLIQEAEILRFMEYFLNYIPDTVHIIISCRHKPDFELSRLKASGSVVEINRQDLEFNKIETISLLTMKNGERFDEVFVNKIHSKMNGWALGLCLTKLAFEGLAGRQAEFAFSKAKDEIYDYISNELFTGLPHEIQEFLLYTSVLDNINPEVCNYILDLEDAAQKLKYIERKNLFITAISSGDDISYRYHDLLKEFLLSLLSNRKSGAYDKAGKYYLKCGAFEQAVEYFRLAGDDSMLVQSVEQSGQKMLQKGRLKTVERWLSILAERGLMQSPLLIMLKGELLSYGGSFSEAEGLIDRAFSLFRETDNKTGLVRAAIHKARIIRYRVSFAESTRFINEFIKDFGELPPEYSLEMAAEKVYSQWLMGDIKGAIDTAESALRNNDSGKNKESAERLSRYMAVLYFLRGRYSAALELYNQILDYCGGEDVLEQGSIPLYMACIYRERNQLEKALEMLKQSVDRKLRLGLTEDLHLIYFNIAVALLSFGDWQQIDYYCKLVQEAFLKTGGHLGYYEMLLKAFHRVFEAYFCGKASSDAESLMDQAVDSLKIKSPYLLVYISPYFILYYLKYKQYEKAQELLKLVVPVSKTVGTDFQIAMLYGLKVAVPNEYDDKEGMIEYAMQGLKLAAAEHYKRFYITFPELLPCIKIAIVYGIEQEFVGELIISLGSGSVSMLLELLKHRESKVRERSATLLKSIHSEQIQKEIELLFFDPDNGVREAGFSLLQEISDEAAQTQTKFFIRCMGAFKTYHYRDWNNPVNWRTSKAKELFAYLLHYKGKAVPSEKILADLWPDLDVEKARNLLHTNLTHVKNFLKSCGLKESLHKDQNGYTLDTQPILCDAWIPGCNQHSGIYMEDIYSDWPYERRREFEHTI